MSLTERIADWMTGAHEARRESLLAHQKCAEYAIEREQLQQQIVQLTAERNQARRELDNLDDTMHDVGRVWRLPAGGLALQARGSDDDPADFLPDGAVELVPAQPALTEMRRRLAEPEARKIGEEA